MTIPMTDMLEGNPEALAMRERYRDVVKALGEANGAFTARFEIRLKGDGSCVLLATSSQGKDCDEDLCKLAVAMIASLTGVRVDPPAETAEQPAQECASAMCHDEAEHETEFGKVCSRCMARIEDTVGT